MKTRHFLKTWPEFFHAVAKGAKTFEIRKNDRDFNEGDFLILREWDPDTRTYTGNTINAEITYMTTFEQKGDNVVLAIRKI